MRRRILGETYGSTPEHTYAEATTVVIRPPSEINDQTNENESGDHSNCTKSNIEPRVSKRTAGLTLDNGKRELG